MKRTKMFAMALALTLLGLAGCETAYGPNPFDNDRFKLGFGSAPTAATRDGGYPMPDGNVLLWTRIKF